MSADGRSRANTFAALALERYSEKRDDNDWLEAQAQKQEARYILLREHDGHALIHQQTDTLRFLSNAERQALLPALTHHFLGTAMDAPHFFLSVESPQADTLVQHMDGFFLDLRSAGLRLPAFDAGLFAYARAVAHWQARTRFCSVCGGSVRLEAGGHRACCTQLACASVHFPRTDAAVIVIVTYQDRCLLGRQPHWPPRRYSTLAGFVEPGETLEDAVRREIFEEAGVHIDDCDYHSSQPWPFPSSLMVGFTARARSPLIHVGSELADARWFSVDELLAGLASRELVLSSPLSISYRLIEHWLWQTAGIELAKHMHDEP